MSDLSDLNVPLVVSGFLAKHGAKRSGLRGSVDATTSLLTERNYPAHPAVLEFEREYGGLELSEPSYEVPTLVAGPFACFSATPPWTGRERDLVPVVFAINDVVYFLDAEGQGWTCATMAGGGTRHSATDGRGLFVQAALWRVLENHPRYFDIKQGLHGAEFANETGAQPIAIACGPTERWWGDEKRLIVEIDYGNGSASPTTYATR